MAYCGVPVIGFYSGGTKLDFLTSTYDVATNKISIELPDKTVALKGTYTLNVAFTSPGIYTFPVGLELTVFDICDASVFS